MQLHSGTVLYCTSLAAANSKRTPITTLRCSIIPKLVACVQVFIVKPARRAQGKGIYLVPAGANGIKKLPKKKGSYVVQVHRYICLLESAASGTD